MPCMTDEQFYTVREVAEKLKVHPRTVQRMIAAREIKAIKVRDTYRIAESALDAYVARQQEKDKQ